MRFSVRFTAPAAFLVLLLGLTACQTLVLQRPDQKKVTLACGESRIEQVLYLSDTSSSLTFLNVHEDEQTSIEALRIFSLEHRINYSYLHHSGERRIQFRFQDSLYSIDPNRIFTDEGRKKTLIDGGSWNPEAQEEVAKFAQNLIAALPKDGLLVALHNNTPDRYSIQSYLPDSSEAQNTAQLYINPEMDPDDFIYTTDERLFKAFSAQKINVILQDNTQFVDDGSLSVYAGIHGISYVNIETEHGHLETQIELLDVLWKLVKPD